MKNFEDEIDFKDVLKNPKRWFGLYYIVLIIGIVAGGIYYLKNINNIYINSVNNSVYLPDSVNIDESAQFMIDAANDEILALASEKEAKVQLVVTSIEGMDNVTWTKTIYNSKQLASMLVNNSTWQGNKTIFVNLILSEIGSNGINSNFTELSTADVDMMYSTLSNLINGTKSNA